MFVILVYDVKQKRVARVLKVARRYLVWVQRSVLHGEISEANLRALQEELLSKIDVTSDSCLIYVFKSARYSSRISLGAECPVEGFVI